MSAERPARTCGRTRSALLATVCRTGISQGSGDSANYVSIVFFADAVTSGGGGKALNFIIVRDRLLGADHHDVAVQGFDLAGAA